MRPHGLLITIALTAALLLAPPAEHPPAAASADSTEGCQPLDASGLAAQVIGTPVRTTTVDDRLHEAMASQAGTAILFGQAVETAEQVSSLIAALDDAAPEGLPPLVAVDEEGGRVSRLGRAGLTPHLPSARDMADHGTPEQTGAAATELAQAMSGLGFDLDLAPVLDLSDAPADSIIGDRSFSADPAVAGDHAAAFAAGLHAGGIAAMAKHFPDHGLTTTDTHDATATVEVTADQLRRIHLEPYRRALPDLDAIMLSHLRISAFDAELPTSLSPAAVSFLRSELGFTGVVATDDLSMQAVADAWGQTTAAVMALVAGVDLVLIGDVADVPSVHGAVVSAVHDGTLSQSRIREAVRRVLRLKDLPADQVTCVVGPSHYGRPR